MGMDVTGIEPTTKAGEYFRRNVWGWHPLAEIVCKLEPKLTAHCRHWHSNDGDGLDEEICTRLAKALQEAIATGRAHRHVKARDNALAKLPLETCGLCSGTGIRRDDIAIKSGQQTAIIGPDTGAEPDHPRYGQTGWCNGCNGRGSRPDLETFYRVTVDDIAEFATFLEGCGGFEIC